MAVKLTKNEQKKQKELLKTYERFLPTLLLKKKMLQSVIKDYRERAEKAKANYDSIKTDILSWSEVFAENKFLLGKKIEDLVVIDQAIFSRTNVAGVFVPTFEKMTFKDADYNIEEYPLWVDKAVEGVKKLLVCDLENSIYSRALFLLEKELKTTSERVNLFEKVKIPETKNNIKKISIAIQDQEVASVVRGKISQKKLKDRA